MRETTTDVRIRDARPEDVPFIAWVMLTAARSHLPLGMWDFMVGPDEAETLRFLEALASTPDRHWAHHANFIVAEADGRPASALCGYFEEECGIPSLVAALPGAARAVGRDFEEMMRAWVANGGASIAAASPKNTPGAWIVEHVATLPEYRRRGLVDRLLAAMIEKGSERGATVADVGVLIGNDPAQRAYEKAGFAVVSERRDAAFEAAYGCPGIRNLSQPI
jgi:translation initiation factor 4G